MSQTIKVEKFLPFAPSKVWRALTDAALVGQWLMPCDFIPSVGHRFTFDTGGWGLTQCEVVAVEPETLVSYTWRNPPLDTLVTWRLMPRADGTLLTMEHSGFDRDDPGQEQAYTGMGQGWRGMIMQRLLACLQELAPVGA
jgi:uncharacterized protein YndB with AHSA1/START domain